MTTDQMIRVDPDRISARFETDSSKHVEDIVAALKTFKCFKEVSEGKLEKNKDGTKCAVPPRHRNRVLERGLDMKELIARLQSSFATLSQRERRMVSLAGAAISVFVLFMVVHSVLDEGRLDPRAHLQKLRKLDEVQTLALGFRETEAKRLAIETQLKQSNIRLITYLEDKAGKTGIELPSINLKVDVTLDGDQIVESAVELALTDVNFGRPARLLSPRSRRLPEAW